MKKRKKNKKLIFKRLAEKSFRRKLRSKFKKKQRNKKLLGINQQQRKEKNIKHNFKQQFADYSVRAPVGDLNIATNNCAIGRGLAALRSKQKCNSFLFYLLQSLKPTFDISDGEGTIFGSINKDDLHNVPIVYSEEIIFDFEKQVKPIDNLIELYCKEIQKLQELQSLLLAKMASIEDNRVFTGINTNIVTI